MLRGMTAPVGNWCEGVTKATPEPAVRSASRKAASPRSTGSGSTEKPRRRATSTQPV